MGDFRSTPTSGAPAAASGSASAASQITWPAFYGTPSGFPPATLVPQCPALPNSLAIGGGYAPNPRPLSQFPSAFQIYEAVRTAVFADLRNRPPDAPVADPSVATELLLLRKEVGEMKRAAEASFERMDGELTLLKYVVSNLLAKTEACQKADDKSKTRAPEDAN